MDPKELKRKQIDTAIEAIEQHIAILEHGLACVKSNIRDLKLLNKNQLLITSFTGTDETPDDSDLTELEEE